MQPPDQDVVFRLKSNFNIMKKATVFGFILVLAIAAYSQDREYKTLVDFDNIRISGFGGPFMQFTAVDGEFAHMMGGGAAILVGDFFFGGYGLGLTNQIQADPMKNPDFRVGDYLSVGHGGFWLGYSLFGDRAIHVCISTLLGWGELGIKGEYYVDNVWPDNIFMIAPTLEVELNLTRYFRIGAGATYNLFTFVDLQGYSASDFSSPGGFLSFKFGWF
jgi:hypothetical protein